MDEPDSRVVFPANLPELFYVWSKFPKAKLAAGGTEFLRNQNGRIPVLPEKLISLDRLEELRKIRRTEKYLEIGAMTTLNRIVQLGRIVPEILVQCIECIASPQLRSLATIGGNLCNISQKLDCSAPMIALDAQYELRKEGSARWISAARFSSLPGPPDLARQELMTRIRIPLNVWNFRKYRKLRASGNNEPGGGMLFIMRFEKNILANIRVVYSGQIILRERSGEIMLEGKRLPLNRKDVSAFIDKWKAYLSVYEGNENSIFAGIGVNSHPDLERKQLLNFIENTLHGISE